MDTGTTQHGERGHEDVFTLSINDLATLLEHRMHKALGRDVCVRLKRHFEDQIEPGVLSTLRALARAQEAQERGLALLCLRGSCVGELTLSALCPSLGLLLDHYNSIDVDCIPHREKTMKLTTGQQRAILQAMIDEARRLGAEGLPIREIVQAVGQVRDALQGAYCQGISMTLVSELWDRDGEEDESHLS